MTQLEPLQIRDIAEQLDIDTPILSHKVIGSRVELYLLGGAVATFELEQEPQLDEMSYDELYALARKINLRGRSNMLADELRVAIAEQMEAA